MSNNVFYPNREKTMQYRLCGVTYLERDALILLQDPIRTATHSKTAVLAARWKDEDNWMTINAVMDPLDRFFGEMVFIREMKEEEALAVLLKSV